MFIFLHSLKICCKHATDGLTLFDMFQVFLNDLQPHPL